MAPAAGVRVSGTEPASQWPRETLHAAEVNGFERTRALSQDNVSLGLKGKCGKERNMKKTIAVLCVLFVAGLMFTACGPKAGEQPKAKTGPESKAMPGKSAMPTPPVMPKPAGPAPGAAPAPGAPAPAPGAPAPAAPPAPAPAK